MILIMYLIESVYIYVCLCMYLYVHKFSFNLIVKGVLLFRIIRLKE